MLSDIYSVDELLSDVYSDVYSMLELVCGEVIAAPSKGACNQGRSVLVFDGCISVSLLTLTPRSNLLLLGYAII